MELKHRLLFDGQIQFNLIGHGKEGRRYLQTNTKLSSSVGLRLESLALTLPYSIPCKWLRVLCTPSKCNRSRSRNGNVCRVSAAWRCPLVKSVSKGWKTRKASHAKRRKHYIIALFYSTIIIYTKTYWTETISSKGKQVRSDKGVTEWMAKDEDSLKNTQLFSLNRTRCRCRAVRPRREWDHDRR